jgi:hypothetical protein
MLISRAKWVRFSLILFLSALFVSIQPPDVIAQDAIDIVVESSTADSNFPDDMRFELAADVDGDVERVDLVYEESRVETLELLPAAFDQSGDDLSASAVADFATYYVPAGIDLTYHWVITFDDDDVAETEQAVVTWLDDRFEWDRADGNGVEIYSYDRSDDFIDRVVETANDAVGELTELYDPPSTLPIRIWLYESDDDFAGTLAANSEEWAAGAAYPALQLILAVIPEDSDSEVLRIIPHEISHQILYQATLNPFNSAATWIDEGLAVSAQIGGKNHYQRLVENAYDDGDLLSLRGLISSFPFDAAEATLAYGESYLVTQFILDQYGEDAVQAIIAAYRNGASHDDVLRDALGLTIEELEQAWLGELASNWRGDQVA